VKNYDTKIINIVSGPGTGKSTLTGLIFAYLKIYGFSAEIVSEYAKQLVWLEKLELLNNQYHISFLQYNLFKSINNKVEYIITDGSLLHGLVYNETNLDNVSNVQKTEEHILKWFHQFNNITLFLERNKNVDYEQTGRIQDLEEALKIDQLLLNKLNQHSIPFKTISLENIDVRKNRSINIEKIIDLIIER